MMIIRRHCEKNEATEGSFILRSNPLVCADYQRIASSQLLRFASQLFLAMTVVSSALAQSPSAKHNLLARIEAMPSGPNFAIVAAQLRDGKDIEGTYAQLDSLLAKPYGDMFWMYGCAGLYYATQDVLRPSYKDRVRWCWKHFTPYRGDTENHFLMYYGSLFLMSQAWPDLADTEWFMGKSSKAIYDEAKDYLDHWIDETVRFGMTEWSSPRYDYYYITPLVLLAEYTKDARMKHRFEMMLEYVLADYAQDYLNGNYCGAHSRVSDEGATDPRNNETAAYGEYFFGDTITHLQPDVAFAALSSFVCPNIIRQIASDRSEPYESYSLKRGRPMIRYMDKWTTDSSLLLSPSGERLGEGLDSTFHAPVYKYDYMTKDYCLGSMQGGIVQPIQQQSWSLVFNSDKPHNIITGLHPYVSAEELGMFFPEYPSFMLERIGNTKKGYTNENKWVGGSPYERIYQDKNVLVALYDLPDSVKWHHVDLFIPDSARLIWEEHVVLPDSPPGSHPFGDSLHPYELAHWSVFQFDSTLVAIQPLSSYEILKCDGGTRWRIPDSKYGYILFCGSTRSTTIDSFIAHLQIVGLGQDGGRFYLTERGTPESDYDGSKGKPLIDFGPDARLQIVDWLFKSPYLESKKGSGVMTMRYKGDERVLDFNF